MNQIELKAIKERALSGMINRNQGKDIILKMHTEIERLNSIIDNEKEKKRKTKDGK